MVTKASGSLETLVNESTEFEDKFLFKLVRMLNFKNIAGEVHKNVLIAHNGDHRCPDLYIPRSNLVIEIDGPTHDYHSYRIKRDETRDSFYDGLGLSVLRLPANWVGMESHINRIVYDVAQFIAKNHPTKAQRVQTAKAIHLGRQVFLRIYHKVVFPSQKVRLKVEGIGEHLEAQQWYGGLRIKINPKVRRKRSMNGSTSVFRADGKRIHYRRMKRYSNFKFPSR